MLLFIKMITGERQLSNIAAGHRLLPDSKSGDIVFCLNHAKENANMQPAFQPPVIPTYSNKPMPEYRHLPFKTPHPYMDEGGHSYGQDLPKVESFDEQNWQRCDTYLFAIDLFNQGYWWEAHELLKQVCYCVGRDSQIGSFLEAVIQIAAGELKHFMQEEQGAQALIERGLSGLQAPQPIFLGIDVAAFRTAIENSMAASEPVFPRIQLKL